MKSGAAMAIPLVLSALLAGCAVPAEAPSNPLDDLEKVIELIPWAKSVASDASTEQLSARIGEITAGLPALDIPPATRADIEAKLSTVSAELLADPASASAHVAELNAIIEQIKASL